MKNKEKIISLLVLIYVFFYVLPMSLLALNQFAKISTFNMYDEYIYKVLRIETIIQRFLKNKACLEFLFIFYSIINLMCIIFLVKKSKNIESQVMRIFLFFIVVIFLFHTIMCFLSIIINCTPGDLIHFGN